MSMAEAQGGQREGLFQPDNSLRSDVQLSAVQASLQRDGSLAPRECSSPPIDPCVCGTTAGFVLAEQGAELKHASRHPGKLKAE